MTFQLERSSEARFSRFCLARAVRRRMSRAARPLPTEGTTSDKAGAVDALSPELSAPRDLRLVTQERTGEDMRRGARFGNGIGE